MTVRRNMFDKKKLILVVSLAIFTCFAARQFQVNRDNGFGKEPRLCIQVLGENHSPLTNVQLSLQRVTLWEDETADGFIRTERSIPEKLSFSKEISLKYDFAESWDLVISAPGYYSELIHFPENHGRSLHWKDKGKYQENRQIIMLVSMDGETELCRKEGSLKLESNSQRTKYFYLKELENREVSSYPGNFQSGPYLSLASSIPFEEYIQLWEQRKFEQLPKTVLLRLNEGENEDGFIPVPNDGLIRNVRSLVTAPESGYKKEIPLTVGDEQVFLYFKLGQYYGKAYVFSVNNRAGRLEATIRMFFNPVPGNRNLRSSQVN